MQADDDTADVFGKYGIGLHVSLSERPIEWFYMVSAPIKTIYVVGDETAESAIELLRKEAQLENVFLTGPYRDEFEATLAAEMRVAELHDDQDLIKELRRINRTWTNLGSQVKS